MSRAAPMDWIAAVAVDTPEKAGPATVTVTALSPGGAATVLATWQVEAPRDARVVVGRSPDRTAVAAVVHDTLVSVGSSTAPTLVRLDTAAPPPGISPPDLVPHWRWDTGTPHVLNLDDAPVRVELEADWMLEIDGAVSDDDGHTGDETWASGVLVPLDAPPGAFEEAVRELRSHEAARAMRPVGFSCSVSRDGTRTVVHREHAAPLSGRTVAHWPPVVGSFGMLLRRSLETVVLPPDEYEGTHTAMQHPWVVRRDGTVGTIPTALGVSPLCELPDGRLLLPGSDALWLDGRDEPLHALDLDGRLSPLRRTGDPVHATELLRLAAPDLASTALPAGHHDSPWGVTAARVDASRAELVLQLTEEPWNARFLVEDLQRCVVVALPLDAAGPPRALARIDRRPGHHVELAL